MKQKNNENLVVITKFCPCGKPLILVSSETKNYPEPPVMKVRGEDRPCSRCNNKITVLR